MKKNEEEGRRRRIKTFIILRFMQRCKAHEVYDLGSSLQDTPSLSFDLVSSIYSGLIKAALQSSYRKAEASERSCMVYKKPSLTVKVKCDVSKGSLKLVALSNSVVFQEAETFRSASGKIHLPGVNFTSDGKNMAAIVMRQMQFPNIDDTSGFARKSSKSFVVSYWAVAETYDEAKINAERRFDSFPVKIGSDEYALKVPTIVNTKALKAHDEVFVLKECHDTHDAQPEPTTKRVRLNPPTDAEATDAKNKGKKGTGEGKAKATAKGKR